MAGSRANIKPYSLSDRPAGKINVTDPDSRNLKATRGWVQGYNAQAVVTTARPPQTGHHRTGLRPDQEDRFLRRGRSAVRSEWRLLTATHKLLKLHRYSLQAAGA